MEIEVGKLFIGKCNARRSVGDVTELARSIEEKGILQPLIVRPAGSRYEVIVGSRRLEAAKVAQLKKIPAIVREMDDGEAISLSLMENIQRSDLEPEEEAEAILKLMKLDVKRFGNIKGVAKAIGKSESAVRELLEAYELTFKLRETGMKVHVARAPSEEERKTFEALPLRHTRMVAEAIKTEEVKRLPEREMERKIPEIVKTIAPLPEREARKVIDRFKMFPEKPVEKIKEEALARERGVAVQVYFAPHIARALDKASEDRGLFMEELVSIAVEEWLVQKGYLK